MIVKAMSNENVIRNSGNILYVNVRKELPVLCQRKRFCGLPMGVSAEPTFTANASKTINLDRSFFILFSVQQVIGTTIKSVISLVKKVESKAAKDTENKANCRSVLRLRISLRDTFP